MNLIRMFISFVISLMIGLGYVFNDNSYRYDEIKDDTTQDIFESNITETNEITEIIEMPQENEHVSNITSTEKQTKKSMSESETKTAIDNSTSLNPNSSNDNYVQKSEQSSNNQDQQENQIDNSIDTSSFDYNSHKGRIDCTTIQECMDISLPIQFRFAHSITNSFYIEVKTKSDISLGYFIEYRFKESSYSSNEECIKIGNEIKQTLSDRVISYQCNDNILRINTDY